MRIGQSHQFDDVVCSCEQPVAGGGANECVAVQLQQHFDFFLQAKHVVRLRGQRPHQDLCDM